MVIWNHTRLCWPVLSYGCKLYWSCLHFAQAYWEKLQHGTIFLMNRTIIDSLFFSLVLWVYLIIIYQHGAIFLVNWTGPIINWNQVFSAVIDRTNDQLNVFLNRVTNMELDVLAAIYFMCIVALRCVYGCTFPLWSLNARDQTKFSIL